MRPTLVPMKRWIGAVTLAASMAFPAAAGAQPAGGPPPGGPPPAARAQMRQALADANAAAQNALTPSHRDAVARITNAVAARSVEPRAAAQQIDALLTADEKTRLAAIEQKLRTQMRGAFRPGSGSPPPGRPPPPPMGPPAFGDGGPPPGSPPAGPPPGGFGRQPDPGRFLLMLARSRRFLAPEPRSSGAP